MIVHRSPSMNILKFQFYIVKNETWLTCSFIRLRCWSNLFSTRYLITSSVFQSIGFESIPFMAPDWLWFKLLLKLVLFEQEPFALLKLKPEIIVLFAGVLLNRVVMLIWGDSLIELVDVFEFWRRLVSWSLDSRIEFCLRDFFTNGSSSLFPCRCFFGRSEAEPATRRTSISEDFSCLPLCFRNCIRSSSSTRSMVWRTFCRVLTGLWFAIESCIETSLPMDLLFVNDADDWEGFCFKVLVLFRDG